MKIAGKARRVVVITAEIVFPSLTGCASAVPAAGADDEQSGEVVALAFSADGRLTAEFPVTALACNRTYRGDSLRFVEMHLRSCNKTCSTRCMVA